LHSNLTISRLLLVITSTLFVVLFIYSAYSSFQQQRQAQIELMQSMTQHIHNQVSQLLNQQKQHLSELQKKAASSNLLHEVPSEQVNILNLWSTSLRDLTSLSLVKQDTNFLRPEGISLDHYECSSPASQNASQWRLCSPKIPDNREYFWILPIDESDYLLLAVFEFEAIDRIQQRFNLAPQKFIISNKKSVLEPNASFSAIDTILVQPIQNAPWSIRGALSDNYAHTLILKNLMHLLPAWLLVMLVLIVTYQLQKRRSKQHNAVLKDLEFSKAHDELTGLTNRKTFEHQLDRYIKRQSFENKPIGILLLLNIDKFKLVNNNLGHQRGDALLQYTSMLLTDYLPNTSIISRLGNDEFAVLLPNVYHRESKHFSDALRQKIQNYPFNKIKIDHPITVSISVLHIDKTTTSVEQALAALHRSVNLAKQNGGNRVQLYQTSDDILQKHEKEMLVVNDLSIAIKQNRLTLYRQKLKPIAVDNKSELRYEVLVRMHDINGQLISPETFISAAEKYALITQLDRWVLRATFYAISHQEPSLSTRYGINISGLTLADVDFTDYVDSLFQQYQVAPSRINFEITETYAITHFEVALKFMKEMKERGCTFSLDDFGSGISSFNYLQRLPVDSLKIDGAFIRKITSDPLQRVFVETVQHLANEMKIKTIAEFVESQAIESYLAKIGVNYAQGDYVHKPEVWFNYNMKVTESIVAT